MKVSLFLQDGIQKQDGTISLSYFGKTPPGVEVPGKIVYFDASGGSTGVDSFSFPNVERVIQGHPAGSLDGCETKLGCNLYARDGASNSVASVASFTSITSSAHPTAEPPQADSAAAERAILEDKKTQQSTRDLNVLANLIGPPQAPMEAFKLNLFPSSGLDIASSGNSGSAVPMIIIDMGDKALQSTNRDLVGIMSDMDRLTSLTGNENDDLLDLLDSAN